jgi:hypothetical protein
MHRLIFDRYKEKSLYVDHIDGNPLNNQKNNLRYATNQQNQWNSKLKKNNTSGHRGVSWDRQNKKWIAQAMHNRKLIKIGRYAKLADAVQARQNWSEKIYGDYLKK